MIPSSLRVYHRVLRPQKCHVPRFSTSRKLMHSPAISPGSIHGMAKLEEEIFGNEKGVYFPVKAGDIITGDNSERFEIVRKIGRGANASVWVARDCSQKASPKYLALKILNKFATRELEKISANEVAVMLRARVGLEPEHRPQMPAYVDRGLPGPPHEGWFRVSGLRGVFTCESGQYLVIVSPLYGEHMRDYMLGEPNKRLPLPLVKRVARQVLLALDYLHRLCGIIHCDVKPENILRDFNLGANVDEVVEAVLKNEPDAGRDGHSASLWVPHNDKFDYFYVVLADFGHSSWKDLIERSPRKVGSPAIKAPELVFAYAYGPSIDIWAFGCTIFELLTGKLVFSFPESPSRSPNDFAREPKYYLSLAQSLLNEPFSPVMSEGTMTIEKGFVKPDGWISSPVRGSTLEERVANDVPEDIPDKEKIQAFLRRCLRIDPSSRTTAAELLEDPWLSEA